MLPILESLARLRRGELAFRSSSFFSHSCALFCAILHFFALAKNSTHFPSNGSALFAKNPGWGVPRAAGFQLAFAIQEGNPRLQQAQRIHIHQHRRIGDFFRFAIRHRAAQQLRQHRALRRLQQKLEPVFFFQAR